MSLRPLRRIGACAAVLFAFAILASAAPKQPPTTSSASAKRRHKKVRRASAASSANSQVVATRTRLVPRTTMQAAVIHTRARTRRGHRLLAMSPWTEPTYQDSTVGDNIDGEDLVVRKAAVDALGPYNGTVVVADPQTGRLMTMVNQKLALKGAFEPCSTVKLVVSLASLSEGLVTPDTQVRIGRRSTFDLTRALTFSNNLYFAKLGEELGFERVVKYGKTFGLGEKAGLDIPGEEPGSIATQPPPTGVGMMTSFGDGIRLTPLELTSLVTAIANGGTMYYLQYPKNQDEVQKFVPRIKRTLDIANLVTEIRPGMMGAVEFGTARRANFDQSIPILGKTGTCTDTTQPGVHLGWFGSFSDLGKNKLVVVVLLTGGRGISGPIASGIAGNVYHNLSLQHFFAAGASPLPTSLVSFHQ